MARLTTLVVSVTLMIASVPFTTNAIMSRVAPSYCGGAKCSNVMSVATKVIGPNEKVQATVVSLVAILILGAIVCILAGWQGMLTGGRGGGTKMVAGASGLLCTIFVIGFIL